MKHFYILWLLLAPFQFFSQELRCGTEAMTAEKMQELEEEERRKWAVRPSSEASYTIPIVFHILHLNGRENITDIQVRDALRILNRDFAKKNADTIEIIPEFQKLASSAGIQFALATKDPSGNCTNGINRYYDPNTDWDENSKEVFAYTWDPTRYLNIYVVKSIKPAYAGYTYMPGLVPVGDKHSAIVVLNRYFGAVGTSSVFTSRTLTHEAGHWLGLYHIFGPSNSPREYCAEDDLVDDTPLTGGYRNCPVGADPSLYRRCMPGISENFQNYMDFSSCRRMFTAGQVKRMQNFLHYPMYGRDNLWTAANLEATGVVNPAPCQSTSEASAMDDISVFPNPSVEGVHVLFTLTNTAEVNLILTDALGRECESTGVQKLEAGRHQHTFNINGKLEQGMYFLRTQDSEGGSVRKVIIQSSAF